MTEDYINGLKSCLETTADGEALPASDFLHIKQAKRILQGSDRSVVIEEYLARGCIVEALVLSKLWHNQTAFVRVLKEFHGQLRKENKLQQMAKVSKALEKLLGNNSNEQSGPTK